ncbi:MAG: hypothetical protein HC896_13550 [Bacteroidales bacterium]|nr:hypothetical protein [Bacteroidales bacterium]
MRIYEIPRGLLKPGQTNVITIKVYDSGGEGGIYNGPVGLITKENKTVVLNNNKFYSSKGTVENLFWKIYNFYN